MKLQFRWTRNTLLFGGATVWGLLLISCVAVNRTALAPPRIAGATFVGTNECAQCHEENVSHFDGATHSRLALSDPTLGATGCEACHGPGSLHVETGGVRGTIVNPERSPETCYQCHLEKRGQFSLPNAHPVSQGQVSCSDCHEPHQGEAIIGSGTNLATAQETCATCHTQQQGPFVFEHAAVREGCTICHNPHGSVNAKMLVARDDNLCLRCHLEIAGKGQIIVGGADHVSRLAQGTCWSAGCHEAVHGSNTSMSLRH